MPDVDRAIRLLTYACTTEFLQLSFLQKQLVLSEFYNLPEVNKPCELRGKTFSEISSFFLNLYSKSLFLIFILDLFSQSYSDL